MIEVWGSIRPCGVQLHGLFIKEAEGQAVCGLARFKPTTRGTVATLCDTKIYDINETLRSHQTANKRPTPDHQATTNKNDKNEKNEKKEKAELLCELLSQLIRTSPSLR